MTSAHNSGVLSESSLARRIASAPHRAANDAGSVKAEAWLSSIADAATKRRLTEILSACPLARAMLDGIADYSPHLWDLISFDPRDS